MSDAFVVTVILAVFVLLVLSVIAFRRLQCREHVASNVQAAEHTPTRIPSSNAADSQPSKVPTATSEQLGVRAFMRGDYEKAFTLLEPAAQADYLRAQIILSKMYYAGHGVPCDKEQYVYWLRRAAENGDKPSKTKLKKLSAS